MRILAVVFLLLILALQYPMWLGKGGWLQVRELARQVDRQREANSRLKARNDSLAAEVSDLKTGSEAIEERARAELGMVKRDEVFFMIQDAAGAAAPGAVTAAPGGGTPSGAAARATGSAPAPDRPRPAATPDGMQPAPAR